MGYLNESLFFFRQTIFFEIFIVILPKHYLDITKVEKTHLDELFH